MGRENLGRTRRSFWMSDEDMEALTSLRDMLAMSTLSDALRYAIRELDAQLKEELSTAAKGRKTVRRRPTGR